MNFLIKPLIKLGIERQDLEYHLIRAWIVAIYLLFGYQKWFEYEAQALVPFIRNVPLISWMFPVFGMRGATYFLGVSEWAFGALLFMGCWNKKLGILGALVRAGVSDLYYPRQERTWRQTRKNGYFRSELMPCLTWAWSSGPILTTTFFTTTTEPGS